MKVLGGNFFLRSTADIAKELLGASLARRYRGKTYSYMITEVEVYDGLNDKASHASRGKTKRNAPMFGPAGHWYVYFTYGMHWMLNIVTREEGYPAAILIRAVEGINGPARLTKALHVDKKLNGLPATKKSGLWVAAPNFSRRASLQQLKAGRLKIKKSPRIGVTYAGPVWSKKLWRFTINDSHPSRVPSRVSRQRPFSAKDRVGRLRERLR